MMFDSFWAIALELLLKSTAVLAAAGLASLLSWRASAARRHAIWTLALASLLLLPVLGALLPYWRSPALYSGSLSTSAVRVIPPTHIERQPAGSPDRTALVVLAVWMGGVLVCFWRWRNGASQVARLRRLAAPLSKDHVSGLARELGRLLGMRRPIDVLVSDREVMPMAAGFRQPAVLLPAGATLWSRERLRVVLLHELAHIQRNDGRTQALAETVRCLYWFHPLVWFAAHRLRVERERACDDLVLCAGSKPSDYAAHLLDLARSLRTPEFAHAAMTVARPSQLEARLQAILNPRLNRRALTPLACVLACLAAASLVLPLAAMRPQATNPQTITGTLYDPEGARVPDARVAAIQTETGDKQTATTDQEGKFSIGPLADGAWRFEVAARGFGFAVRTIQKVYGQHFDITLDLGSVQETLFVRGKGTPAPATTGPHRVRVGGNVTPAKLIQKVNPEYPESVRSRGIQGDVVLRAVILMDGSVGSPAVVTFPDPELGEAAKNAVRQWRYEPSLLNGKPMETVTSITVNFQLEP